MVIGIIINIDPTYKMKLSQSILIATVAVISMISVSASRRVNSEPSLLNRYTPQNFINSPLFVVI
jgi:hypothetical protein